MKVTMTPYLFFDKCCEEALTVYKEVLGGDFSIAQRYDNGFMEVAPGLEQKVMHAHGDFAGNAFFAADNLNMDPEKQANRVALSLNLESPEKGTEVFEKLSVGGKIHVPFTKQFWGAWHGNFTDRFGIRWMINCD